ncbi:rhomboid family-domain-containing protein [Lactarius pseudohatsudake]|nr:rhomboid family-domain-containing protein [Lactarius pseudohatsudake]
MTSSVPLQTYNQHRSPSEYTDGFDSSPARKSTLSYAEEAYDPYTDTPGKSWGNTAFAESATDSDVTHKPSLSYASKELGKWLDQLRDEPTDFPSIRGAPMNDKRPLLARWFDPGRYPLQQRIEDKRRGIGRQRYPVVVWALTIIMVAVFIYELVVNAKAQGSPISFHVGQFPNARVRCPDLSVALCQPDAGTVWKCIDPGGRSLSACMKTVPSVPVTLQMPCLNDTANPPDRLCTIEDLCGHGGFHGKEPDQWWRRVYYPHILHAGFIHIALNMLAQLTAAAEIEREMGSGGFFILYFAAGIFGNVLGGNFSLVGVPSVGASGAIFGTLAVTWVDLFAHWKILDRPARRFFWMLVELIIGIAIGYIPYVDNFGQDVIPKTVWSANKERRIAHIGGFVMGLLSAQPSTLSSAQLSDTG